LPTPLSPLSLHDALPISAAFLGPCLLESYVSSHPLSDRRSIGLTINGFAIVFLAAFAVPLMRNFHFLDRNKIESRVAVELGVAIDRKSTRLNSSHLGISY